MRVRFESHLAAILVLLSAKAIAATEASPLTEAIHEAWRNRTANLAALNVTFRTTCVDFSQVGAAESPEPKEQKYVVDSSLTLDVDRFRYDVHGQRPRNGSLSDSHFIATFDGKTARLLHAPDDTRDYHAGFIQHTFDLLSLETMVLLWHCRPAAYLLPPSSDGAFSATEDHKYASDTIRIEMQEDVPEVNDRQIHHVWIDKSHFNVLRWEVRTKDAVRIEATCQYAEAVGPHDTSVPFPDQWSVVVFGDGGAPVLLRHGKTTGVTFSQDKLRESAFRLTFPVGTVVSDSTQPLKSARSDGYAHIVMPDGNPRPILWSERFTPHSRLMITSPGEATGPAPRSRTSLLLWANLAALVTIAGITYAIRFRNRSQREFSSPS